MSKFWFFDRKGRPTLNEKKICDKFNSLINEGTVSANKLEEYIEEYGKPMNETELDDMFGFLTGEYSSGDKYQYDDSDSDFDSDDEGSEYEESVYEEVNQDSGEKKDPINFNPFEEPVIERSYTSGFNPKSNDDESDSEDNNDDDSSGDSKVDFSDDDLKIPTDGEGISDDEEEEDIPEPEWASTGGVSSSLEDDEEDDEDGDYDDEDGDGKLGGDNLQDLSPAQKRKSAEKTAEALLNMYCQFAPMPFKKWASIKEGKVQKLVFENKIDLSMQLENNVSVKDYIDGTNEQVEEIFKVSDETREEIKDPLIDVLLEQDLALTPTQRLMLAIGGHIVTMGFSAFQLAQNNKQALETFEKFHSQMNRQTAPVYQETERVSKKPRPQADNLSKHEKESVEEIMRMMNSEDEDDIIDAEHDPNVEVSEDYGEDD
jgi:hypothetical protein